MSTLTLLLAYFGDIQIETLNFDLIRRWKSDLSKTRTDNTVRGYIIKLRMVLKHARDSGIPVIDYETIPVPQRADTIPSYVSEEQVQKLIDFSTRLRSKAIIALLYSTGVRVSELCSLNRDQVHDCRFSVIGKGGKVRICFIDKRACTYLKEYLQTRTDNHSALFISQTGKRVTPTNVQLLVRLAAKNAGYGAKHITPHTIRHGFATNLMQNGMHIYKVQRLMGHSSIQTTEQYLHVTDPDLQMDFAKYHTV